MPAIFEHYLEVSQSQIDRLGHVNNIEYLRWMQDAAVQHSTAQGWPSNRYAQLKAGWIVRSHKIEYLAQAFLGDKIMVKTWVASVEKIRSLRKFKILRTCDNATLAVAETQWVFVSYDRQLPCRIPAEVRDAYIVVAREYEP